MKHSSPLESPKHFFSPTQASNSLRVPQMDQNVVRNLGVNFEELMPTHSDPTSPNFQKMNDFLKSPAFVGSKPISMVLPEFSQNSCIIPIPDNCLETSMPFEDLVGQLESPKLSDKMQMILNSNVNLSQSIMKNTFRAVDESRVKLEDKDLQIELEIRELKLQHLQKKVEGCLASSKSTLAMNAQLSQNVSRMVSPVKSPSLLSSNIKHRTNSQINSPTRNIEDSPAPVNFQLASSRSDTSSTSKARPKSVNQRAESHQGERNSRAFPTIEDNTIQGQIAQQEESPAFRREGRAIEREISSMSDKHLRSVSLPAQDPKYRFKDSMINEAYQKLNSYQNPKETNKIESNQQAPQLEIIAEAVKNKNSHHRSTESIASNNITFYTNLPEKETHIDAEDQNKNLTRIQSNDCLSEDQEFGQRSHFLFHSKSGDTITGPSIAPEPKMINMPKEILLTDADGKERIFIIKPKEVLSFQRLETICITPLDNKGTGLTQQRVRSQLSSFQLSEIEELSQLNEHLKHAQDQYGFNSNQVAGIHSKKTSFYDNSNIASMNLDKPEYKMSGFSKAPQESIEIGTSTRQKDLHLDNLKHQIINHPKCQKFFTGEDSKSTRGPSAGSPPNINSKENDGLECYFKQKIQDFREFLNEFEKILPTEKTLSPMKDLPKKRKKVKTVIDEELLASNRIYETAHKENGMKNMDLESKTVNNTPRVPVDENNEFIKLKYSSSTKQAFTGTGYLTEQTPQNNNIETRSNIRFENDDEFVPKQLFKENQDSPYSNKAHFVKDSYAATANAIVTIGKPSSNSNIEPAKKKAKSSKNSTQKDSSLKVSKAGKNNRSVALPLNQNTEQIKKKNHDKSASLKSPVGSINSKKSKEIASNNSTESKKLKEKGLVRGNSKSNVEVINLAKVSQRTNSVFIVSPAN